MASLKAASASLEEPYDARGSSGGTTKTGSIIISPRLPAVTHCANDTDDGVPPFASADVGVGCVLLEAEVAMDEMAYEMASAHITDSDCSGFDGCRALKKNPS